MKYAVIECYHSIKLILMEILEEDGRKWLVNISISLFFCRLSGKFAVMSDVLFSNWQDDNYFGLAAG